MIASLWVGLGGAIGSMARYWAALAVARLWGEAFPWGTLLINVGGSFIIGVFATLTLPGGTMPASVNARAFVMAGFCGGFTTFSAFSLQSWDLIRSGAWMAAAANIAASVALCLLAVVAGSVLAARVGFTAP